MDSRSWLVLSLPVPPAGEEFRVVDTLRRLGARAVEREDMRVLAWLPPPGDVPALLDAARAALDGQDDLHWEWQSREAWEERFHGDAAPRRVTGRIVVVPAGASFEPAAGDVVIRLHPGVAFGDAGHPTTQGCLRLLERLLQPGATVLDIGTGSGILAMAAARLGATRVTALEADTASVADARRNIESNGLGDVVAIEDRLVRGADLLSMPPYDLVLANLAAEMIIELLPALRNVLRAGGSIIIAGVTGFERDAVLREVQRAGFEQYAQEVVNGWWCAALRRTAAGRDPEVGR